MEKQYHAWGWRTLSDFRVQIDHLEIAHHNLQRDFDETQRMAFDRYDAITVADSDEAYDIAQLDIDRTWKIQSLIDEMETAIEKMRKLYALINALGSPACEVDEDDEDEDDYDELIDIWAPEIYPEAR